MHDVVAGTHALSACKSVRCPEGSEAPAAHLRAHTTANVLNVARCLRPVG